MSSKTLNPENKCTKVFYDFLPRNWMFFSVKEIVPNKTNYSLAKCKENIDKCKESKNYC